MGSKARPQCGKASERNVPSPKSESRWGESTATKPLERGTLCERTPTPYCVTAMRLTRMNKPCGNRVSPWGSFCFSWAEPPCSSNVAKKRTTYERSAGGCPCARVLVRAPAFQSSVERFPGGRPVATTERRKPGSPTTVDRYGIARYPRMPQFKKVELKEQLRQELKSIVNVRKDLKLV